MSELLTAANAAWQFFYGVCIKGLINFDNPAMSIVDYFLWGNAIVGLLRKLLKFYRR